jgi:hypothetical protein
MSDIKITEVAGGVETVKTEAPVKKVKADVDLKLTPAQIEALIKSRQR